MKRVLLIAACAALFISTGVPTAQANDGYGFGFYPQYGRDHIPYYALHPPVYYSYPVPRPYGWSPFAYPPSVMTPEVDLSAAIAPKTIDNPYVKIKQVPRKPAESHTTAIEPVRISNPFVAETKLASELRGAR
ncbi:MAG: hypothetical protein MPJ50_03165 [Pirellulales bacterium]|nr:hypothetical protein [Pirellulales bacterium]